MNDNQENVIEIDFRSPDLHLTSRLPMIYAGEGLYYIDVWFKSFGSYVIRTFKGGEKLSHNIVQVDSGNCVIYYEPSHLI